MAEPDELICIDKVSGKKLWQRAINYYEVLTPEEKAAQPRLAKEVEPLVAKLKSEEDKIARTKLRKEIQEKLAEIDAPTFVPKYDGHFEAHFWYRWFYDANTGERR